MYEIYTDVSTSTPHSPTQHTKQDCALDDDTVNTRFRNFVISTFHTRDAQARDVCVTLTVTYLFCITTWRYNCGCATVPCVTP